MQKSKTVEEYIAKHPEWEDELRRLRTLLTGTKLQEEIKWGAPCYTYEGHNVVGLAAFKNYCGLWFHQGALLEDARGVLINAQEGKTKALRQWRFTSAKEIRSTWIKAYVREAIALAAAGKSVKPAKAASGPADVPNELAAELTRRKKTRDAFAKLTPGKQREYAAYVRDAKRDATKLARVEKIVPMIEAGIGLNDKYR